VVAVSFVTINMGLFPYGFLTVRQVALVG
jgi:hypothetical protein